MASVIVILLCYLTILVEPAIIFRGKTVEEVCLEKECYEAANHIQKWMNPAFNPCDDFYEFTCGYWHTPDNKTLEQGKNSSLGLKGNIVAYHLKKILQDPPGVQEAPLFELLRTVLSMCMDEDALKARGVAPLVEFMKELGGWPLLEEDWQEQDWNLVNVEIFQSTILNIAPEYYDKMNQTAIKISVVTPDDFDFESNSTLKKMYALAEAFGVSRDKAEKEMNEILELVSDLNEILGGEDNNDTRLYKISELQDDISWLDWTRLLTSVLPDSMTLTEIEPVLVQSPQDLKKLGKYIAEHPKRAIANLQMTILAGELSKYLDPAVANITLRTTNLRYDVCAEIVKDSSLDRVVASYIASVTAEDIKLALEITEQLKDELIKDVTDIKWLDEKTRSDAIKKLSELKIIIGYPETVMSVNTLEDFYTYSKMELNTSNFFEAIIDSKKWKRKDKLRGFSIDEKPDPVVKWLRDINAFHDALAFYYFELNIIVVSSGFFHEIPLFNAKLPLYINYGHLGYVISHELTHALDIDKAKGEQEEKSTKIFDYEDLLLRWGSNATKEIYEEKRQCIIDQYSSFNDTKYTKERLNGTITQREDVADMGGLKLALRAYQRVTENLLASEAKLPLLDEYSPEQLFMISAANFFCEIPEYSKRQMLLAFDEHTLGDFRVRGMMMNSPDFSKFFHCTEKDLMNSPKKCEVW